MAKSEKVKNLWPSERFINGFERGILSAVQLLLAALVVLGLLDLLYLMVRGARAEMLSIGSVDALQNAMQHGFSGVLLVLIGLELLETVRAYLQDHRVRLEVVLIVAVVALGRHIVELDLETMNGFTLLGIAALMLALTGGYFLVRVRTSKARRTASSDHPLPEEGK